MVPTTTARWRSGARVVAREKARSAGDSSGTAVSRWAVSRAACSRRASADSPERSQGTAGSGAACSWGAGVRAGAGAGCSRRTWALVPLMPKEETPARRGRPSASGQTVASTSRETAPESQSTCGVGSSTCRVRGSSPWRIASTILMTPATPAAAWVCPMFDFTDPSHSGRSSGRSCP